MSTIAGSATVVPNGAGGSLTPEGGTTSAGATSAGATASGAGGIEGVAGGAGSGSAGMAADGTCGQGAILCEDFEQYVDGSTPGGNWTATQRGNGKIVVDATRASSGKQSLHVTGRMNADRANISLPIHTDSQTAYVRFMLYTASYPASAGVHTRLMRIGTTQAASGTADTAYSLSSYNGTAIEKVNSIYLRDTGTKLNDPSTLNRWRCWEFSIDKSGGIGKVKVELLVDGRALPLKEAGSSSHGMTSPSWDPIPFEQFMLGLDGFQADEQPADFWIDDLSVTPQHEGCQATL
ncbi:MAG TPA: hypothetical protein VHB79_03715 [Polyangiaceae bacterium]|nr:hypothetical protein [Polyangiaceae bacterium]